MKKKLKTSGIWTALSAVLLISAVLVLGCADAFVNEKVAIAADAAVEGGERLVPAEGMGYIRFRMPNARTIFPNSLGITNISQFTHVDIIVTRTDDSSNSTLHSVSDLAPTSNILGTPGTEAIEVIPGTYTVEILGYFVNADISASPIVVASGRDTGVVVTQTTPGTATIVLSEVRTGSGTGLFKYDLGTLPPLTTAVMSFTPLSGQSAVSNIDFDPTNLTPPPTNGEVTLGAGVWRVATALTLTGSQSVTYLEIVYINQGHTTVYDRSLTPFPALNNTTYTIVFMDWDNNAFTAATSITGSTTIQHGGTIAFATPPAQTATYTATVPSVSTTYTVFEGWHGNQTGTDLWTSTRPFIRNNTTLYAIWREPNYGDLFIDVSVLFSTNPIDPQIVVDDSTTDTDGILELTISNGGDFTGFTWYLNGTEITAGTGVTFGANGALTFDFKEYPLLNIRGNQLFYVEATRTGGGLQSNSITLDFQLP